MSKKRTTLPRPAEPLPTSEPRWLAAILLVALAVRLLYVRGISGDVLSDHLVIDAKFYDEWARRIAAGHWLGDAVFYQDPLYAYFLAAVYKLIGHSLVGVRLLQAVLDTATVGLLYVLGRRLFSPAAGLISAAMAALLGPMVYYVGILDKTTFSLFLIAAAVTLLVEALSRETTWLYAASGAAFGLASLSRGNMLVVAAAAIPWLLLRRAGASIKGRALRTGAFGLATAAVVGAVAARNYAVGHDLVLITANPGLNFFIGNNPYTVGQYIEPPFIRGIPEDEYSDAKIAAERFAGQPFDKPSQVSRYWFGRGLGFIAKDPKAWALLSARKILLAFNDFEIAETYSFYYFHEKYGLLRVTFLTFGWIAALGLAGFAVSFYRRRPTALSLFAAVYLASLVAFFVTSRYRFPLLVALIPMGASLLVEAWRERSRPMPLALFAGVAAAAAVFVWRQPAWMKARVTGPTLSTAHTIAGFLYSDLGDAENGKRELQAAIQANPYAATNHLYLGNLLLNRGEAREGMAELERALELDPELDLAWERLGLARYGAKDYSGAAAAFQKALALRPSEAAYRSNFDAVRRFLPNAASGGRR